MRRLLCLCFLALSTFVCAAAFPPGSVVYDFDSLTPGQHTPLLSLPPDIGPASFQATFTSSPNANAFQATSFPTDPDFSGLSLVDTTSPASSNMLSVALNMAVSGIQLDFALAAPGYLQLVTPNATISFYTASGSQDGSFSVSGTTPFSSFELAGFDINNQPVALAIDNLALTPVPEPGAPWLLLLGLGWGVARRR